MGTKEFHHYHTDNSAVERIEKLRREDEEKYQKQIANLEQDKKEIEIYMKNQADSYKKILEETKNQTKLMQSKYEQQKIDDEKKWNDHIKIIQDNYTKQREADENNRKKEIKLKEQQIETLKEQMRIQNEANIKIQKEQQKNNDNLLRFLQNTSTQSEEKFNQLIQSQQQMFERLMDQTNNEQFQM